MVSPGEAIKTVGMIFECEETAGTKQPSAFNDVTANVQIFFHSICGFRGLQDAQFGLDGNTNLRSVRSMTFYF